MGKEESSIQMDVKSKVSGKVVNLFKLIKESMRKILKVKDKNL